LSGAFALPRIRFGNSNIMKSRAGSNAGPRRQRSCWGD
jgi:hypothetical protein